MDFEVQLQMANDILLYPYEFKTAKSSMKVTELIAISLELFICISKMTLNIPFD